MSRARYIPELLQTHADELAFLWGQRKQALHSPELTQRDFAALAERVEAHLQGLLCAPPADLLELLSPALTAATDTDECFAAGFALLGTRDPAALQAVLQAFARAQGAALQGLTEALATAPASPALQPLQALLQQGPPAQAAAAAAVLASHRLLAADDARLLKLLADPDPGAARCAWQAAARAHHHKRAQAVNGPAHGPTRLPNAAAAHADAAVRDATWVALAWNQGHSAAPALRQAAAAGDAVALRWLAVLGGPDDVATVQQGVLALDDGPARCALLARHGHPSALNALVRWMQDGDEATQVAAGEAFEQISGVDVRGTRREMAVAEDADDFTRGMAPLAWFPDIAKAQAALQAHGTRWSAGQRWRRGVEVSATPPAEHLANLDMQARWDLAARAAWAGAAAPLPPLA